MIYQLHRKFSVVLLAVLVAVVASSSAFGAATIVIQNNDAAGVGFNDPTPVAPVGGNPGTTLGQQRLNAFQFAANIWGATLSSTSTITVRANWEALSCTSTTAVLGSAGAVDVWRDFAGAPFANTWYSTALANKLAGTDLNSSTAEIRARFNLNIGNPGCFESTRWYYGLDNNHGGDVNLVTVLLHEFSHGLGFQTFTNSSTGAEFNSGGSGPVPSIYDRFLFDNTTGKSWVQMTDAERQASAINTHNLVWIGSQIVRDAPGVLSGKPQLKVNSPASIAGSYQVGTADFGPAVYSPGITGNVVQALDAANSAGPTTMDACSPLTNAGLISGNIAIVDRGVCFFTEKVKNAQNAGAIGVIVVDNVAGAVAGMGGTDGTITIPSLRITLADGNTIKAQLGSGVNANLGVDPLVISGADPSGRPQLFTPNPVESGSSVSHWDTSAFPNQLMEPDISADLTHNVIPPDDLTLSLMRDIGWTGTPSAIPNPIDDARAFVQQQYRDFLGRDPDQDGLDYWSGQITLCGNDLRCVHNRRIDVSAAFFVEQEFQRTGSFIYRLFKGGLGRRPSFLEFTDDRSRIVEGQTLEATKQAFALVFVQRIEFTQKYNGMTNANTFVSALILTLQQSPGVIISNQQRQLLIDKYNTGSDMNQSRAFALREAIDNTAFVDAEYNPAFVLMQYFGYLVRDPDQGGYVFWLDILNNRVPGNFRSMVCAFVTSDEYQHRFGSAITRSNQDCGP